MRFLLTMCCRGERPADSSTAAALAAQYAGGVFVTVNRHFSVAHARNTAVQKMYQGDFAALMFVDEDITLQLDAAKLLLELDADVCVGQCPCVRKVDGLEIPHIPIVTQEPTGTFNDFRFKWLDRSETAVPIYRGGTGCMLIHRRVFDELGFPYFRWRPDIIENDTTGEDVDFCDRARAAGFSIMAHANVRCGHKFKQDAGSRLVEADHTPHDVTWPGPQSFAEQQALPPAASHLPVLRTIGRSFDVKSVVEFGIGKHSTPMFLDREYFPSLENLYSLESNEEWLEHNVTQIADERLRPVFCHLAHMAVEASLVPSCDVVFIDCDGEADGDATKEWGRAASRISGSLTYRTRCALLSRYDSSDAIVVLHDTEIPELSRAADLANYRYRITHESRTGCYTTVLSNKHDVSELQWLE